MDEIISNANDSRPSLQEWLKINPSKGINDYYKLFGVPNTEQSYNTSAQITPIQKKAGRWWLFPLIIFSLLIIAMTIMYDKPSKSFKLSKFTVLFESKEKTEIKNQIEKTYFGLINGAYNSEGMKGKGPDDLPFYNQDLQTLLVMGVMPYVNLLSDFNLEAKNISITSITDNEATVNYVLVVTQKKEIINHPISMVMKKIGGHWKLDGHKFLPNLNSNQSPPK